MVDARVTSVREHHPLKGQGNCNWRLFSPATHGSNPRRIRDAILESRHVLGSKSGIRGIQWMILILKPLASDATARCHDARQARYRSALGRAQAAVDYDEL